jgi:hypothetical protein
MLSSQTFASEQKQSVAHMVQEFINTAQGKQQSQRSQFGDTLITSLKSLIQKDNKQQLTQPNNTLFASTTSVQYVSTIQTQINGSVFFADIQDHPYEQSITVLASHKLFKAQEKFYPHNYVRLADLSKIVVNAYRLAVWLDTIQATPTQYVQTAYSEWFLTDVINTVDAVTIEKVLTYADMQTIMDNIHKQYPKLTTTAQVTEPTNEILNKWAMSHYVVQIFNTPLHSANYHNQRYASIQNSPYYDQLRSLVEKQVVQYNTAIDPTATLTRAELIEQVVKTYALSNKVLLTSTAHDVADLDGTDPLAPLLVFAYNQWRLEYVLIQTKGQIFVEPDRTATLDEAYEILQTITNKNFITGIIDAQTPITQEKLAKLLVDAFALSIEPSADPQPSTIINPSTSSLWLVQRVRNLLASI